MAMLHIDNPLKLSGNMEAKRSSLQIITGFNLLIREPAMIGECELKFISVAGNLFTTKNRQPLVVGLLPGPPQCLLHDRLLKGELLLI